MTTEFTRPNLTYDMAVHDQAYREEAGCLSPYSGMYSHTGPYRKYPSGVYFLIGKGTRAIYYIGKGTDLWVRVGQHWKGKTDVVERIHGFVESKRSWVDDPLTEDFMLDAVIYFIESKQGRTNFERACIAYFNPPFNKATK